MRLFVLDLSCYIELEISPLRARFLAFTASRYITSDPSNRALFPMETNIPTFIDLIYISVRIPLPETRCLLMHRSDLDLTCSGTLTTSSSIVPTAATDASRYLLVFLFGALRMPQVVSRVWLLTPLPPDSV